MSVVLGSDPELFLEDETGKVISAIGKIGGTKQKPKPIKNLGKGFAIQEDNVLLEYNTPPAKTQATWLSHHKVMGEYLTELVKKQGLKLSTKASHSMDPDQMQHPKAWIIGCEPDFDAWAMAWNSKPESTDEYFRSAGGHIHISYDNPNPVHSVKIARMCDMLIGAPLARKDPDKKRPLFYGRPAAIRFKPYGFEYRTPSNYWLLNESNVYEVWRNSIRAVQFALQQYDNWEPLAKDSSKAIRGEECDDLDSVLGINYV